MDTPTTPDAPGEGKICRTSCRQPAIADLARRLTALLSTARSPHRTTQPWDVVRALVLLLDPDRLRDFEASAAVDHEPSESVLTVTITRREGDWSLGVVVVVHVADVEDHDVWEVDADELCCGEESIALRATCTLTEVELDHVVMLVEEERSRLVQRRSSDRVAAAEERYDG